MNNNIKNDKGYALLFTFFILILLSILTLSMLVISANTMKISTNERVDQSLYYIAEAGVVEKYNEIEKHINPTFTLINNTYNNLEDDEKEKFDFEKEFFNAFENNFDFTTTKEDFEEIFSEGKPKAVVTVNSKQIDAKTKEYTITSVASLINGKNRKRTVSRAITVSLDSEPGKEEEDISIPNGVGIYAHNDIYLSGGTVNGDIILNKDSCQLLTVGNENPTINGTVYIPESNNCSIDSIIEAPDWWKRDKYPNIKYHTNSYEFPLPEFPKFPSFPKMPDKDINGHKVIDNGNINITDWRVEDYTLTLDSNYTFQNINFNSSRKLTLDIGDRNISIVVDSITGNGHLDVKGKGSLTIYLKNNYELDGHFNSSATDVTMYIDSSGNTKTIKSSNYANFIASIYAKDANIELVGSGKIYGHIVTGGKSVKLSGGTSATSTGYVVYAPNALVELSGSGTLNGSVIANNFKTTGGASVNSTNSNIAGLPFTGIGVNGNAKKVVDVYNGLIVTSTPIKEIEN